MSRRAASIFVILCVAWGLPYLLIKIAVEELSPAEVVLARTGLAALVLLPIAVVRGEIRPLLPRWPWVVAFALTEIAVPWLLLGDAEKTLPSSTAGLLIAALPLASLGVAYATGRAEKPTGAGWLGMVLGIAGVAAIVGLDVRTSHLGAVAVVGVVVLAYACGAAILARRLGDLPGIGVIAASLTLVAVLYTPIVLATDGPPTGLPSARVAWSAIALAAICTAMTFTLLVILIRDVGPVRAATITYINPAVAVIAGAVVLGEQITVWAVLGFVLVVAGSYLVNTRVLPRAATPEASPPLVAPTTS